MNESFRKIVANKLQFIILVFTFLSVSLNIYLVTLGSYGDSYNEELIYEENETDTLIQNEQDVSYNSQDNQENSLPDAKNGKLRKSFNITKSNTLKKLLQAEGIDNEQIKKIMNAIQKVYPLGKISNGDQLILEGVEKQGDIEGASLLIKRLDIISDTSKVEVAYITPADNFEAKHIVLPLETKTKLVSSKVNNSIFSSAKKAGADTRVVMELINLFSYSLDFQRDIRAGDEFKVLYEQQFNNVGKAVSKPTILYAAITARGDEKEIYRHTLAGGKVDYFDVKGESVRRALLKTPINGARMSSGYGFRKHPVLGYSRMHKGLDYAAPVGTPILASGDGVVQFMKNQPRGYGRHIQLRHNGTYSTLYAHLSRFAANIKPGGKVSQGQVIGYVGASGLASGTHLHYEVIEAGKKVNPNKVSFPKVPPLRGNDLKKLQQHIEQTEIQIARLEKENNQNIVQAKAD